MLRPRKMSRRAKLGLLRRNKQRRFHGARVPGGGGAHSIKSRPTEAMRGYANNEQERGGAVLERFTILLNRGGFRWRAACDSRCWLGRRPASDGPTSFQ